MADSRANSMNIGLRLYIGRGLDHRCSDFPLMDDGRSVQGPGMRYCCDVLIRQSDCARQAPDVKNVMYRSRADVGQRQRSSRLAKQLNRCEVLAAVREKHLVGHSHDVCPDGSRGLNSMG